ncbi:unnamed protein product, partial [Gordionus sp. m RMFG-2023]
HSRSLDIHGLCSSQDFLSFTGARICVTSSTADEDDQSIRDQACEQSLTATYKFYLAFENSNCAHYVTEKVFRALSVGTVPVVYGARYADYAKVAPPFSFIYVASPLGVRDDEAMEKSFNHSSKISLPHPYFHVHNLKELAKYLLKLDSNETLYNEYHAWRSKFALGSNPAEDSDNYLCQICRHLHLKDIPAKSYKISEWWDGKKDCDP